MPVKAPSFEGLLGEHPEIRTLVREALREDVGSGDVTSQALVSESRGASAEIVSRQDAVVAGVGLGELVFRELDPALQYRCCAADGETVRPGRRVALIEGRARDLLAGERTALNFMQRLSGIATLTRRFVDKVGAWPVLILDTRKTTPLFRALEKYAVRCGGGGNHRQGLYDRALIKDNHRRLWKEGGGGNLAAAVAAVRGRFPNLPVEVEVESEEELQDALRQKPEWILLDNMPPDRLRACVRLCDKRCRLEASGGITLDNVEAVAATGVDAISLGCLTHSAPAADLSLELL